MIASILSNILRLFALVLIQVLVLDHLDVANGLMVPYLYVLFLLMLPFDLPAWALLLIGALTGLLLDSFASTPGMHMGACTVMMFLRIQLVDLIAPREGYEYGMRPTIASMGPTWYLTFASTLILAHHAWLFIIEAYRFENFGHTLLRILLSSAFTVLLCLLAQFLTAKPKRGRA